MTFIKKVNKMQFLNHEKRRCNIQLSDVSLSFLLDPDIVIMHQLSLSSSKEEKKKNNLLLTR